MEQFLSAPWWVGIQGVIAAVALIAAAVAVTDFIIRSARENIRAMVFTIRQTVALDNTGRLHFEITARPMGPTVLYEARWHVADDVPYEAGAFPPIMRANDREVSITLSIPSSQQDRPYVGVVWVEPRTLGAQSRGSRILVGHARYETWVPYRWIWWPRKRTGRWKLYQPPKRSKLSPPTL